MLGAKDRIEVPLNTFHLFKLQGEHKAGEIKMLKLGLKERDSNIMCGVHDAGGDDRAEREGGVEHIRKS